MANHTASRDALRRAQAKYEERAAMPVVPIRLSAEHRDLLDRLAAQYGGRRQAVEAALTHLASKAGGQPD